MESQQINKQEESIPLIKCLNCKTRIPKLHLSLLTEKVGIILACTCLKEDKRIELSQFIKDLKATFNSNQGSTQSKNTNDSVCSISGICICSKTAEQGKKEQILIDSISNSKCNQHNKLFEKYCPICRKNLCENCFEDNQHFEHNVIKIECADSLEPQVKMIEEVISGNKMRINRLVKLIETKIEKLTSMKLNIQEAFKKNETVNQDLLLLYKSIAKTVLNYKAYPTYELMSLHCNIEINNPEYKEKSSIEDEYNQLLHYFNKNFVLQKAKTTKNQISIDNCKLKCSLVDLNNTSTDNTYIKVSKRSNPFLNCLPIKALTLLQTYFISNENKNKNVTEIPLEIYPLTSLYYIVHASQMTGEKLPPIKALRAFYHYSYHTIKDLEEMIKSDTKFANQNLTFLNYKREQSLTNSLIKADLSPSTLIIDIEDNSLLVCEYTQQQSTFSNQIVNQVFDKDNNQKININNMVCQKENQQIYYNSSLAQLAFGMKGKVGLENIGNTCYMASALQCLSHCDYLTEYFLKYYNEKYVSKDYQKGTKGRLSRAYKELISALWTGNKFSFKPKAFKKEIGLLCDSFSSYGQQDSYELLSYTLNGLHEDINRVIKPIPFDIPKPDYNPDNSELAQYTLNKFRSKSQSLIGDLFYGMYQSNIDCPKGCKIRNYELFNGINLLLNVSYITCVFIYYDLSIKPVEIKIPFESDKKYGHLRQEISELFDVNVDSFVIANVDSNGNIIQLNNTERQVETNAVVYCYQIDPMITKKKLKTQSIINKPQNEIENVMKKVFSCVKYPKTKELTFQSDKENNTEITIDIDNHYNLEDKYVLFLVDIINYFQTRFTQRIMFIDSTLTLSQLCGQFESYFSINNITLTNLTLSLTLNGTCILCNQMHCKTCFTSNTSSLSNLLHNPNPLIINSHLYLNNKEKSSKEFYNSYVIEVQFNNYYNEEKFKPEKLMIPDEGKADYLESCIKEFQTIHSINGQWKCSNCREIGDGKKALLIYSCSHYLIFQLKRFNYSSKKNDRLIKFPIKGLDMTPYVVEKTKNNMIYDLISVSNHFGSYNGGHYTAYAKNPIDNEWREFNDSYVNTISEDQIVSSAAYVLVYKKRESEKEFDKEKLFTQKCIN